MTGTGFVLEQMSFHVCGLEMLIEGLRHARRRTWLRLENRVGRLVPPPFGSSLLALAEPVQTP